METKTIVESRLEELLSYSFFGIEHDGDFIFADSDSNKQIIAEKLGISVEAVEAIGNSFDYMRDELIAHIKSDLVDIWKRID